MKGTYRHKLIAIAVTALLAAAGLAVVALCTPYSIVISGDSTVSVPVNGTYDDQGAHVLLGLGKVQSSGTVDTAVPGRYEITYRYGSFSRVRTVWVVDDQPPVLTLKGRGCYMALDTDYVEYGYRAVDAVDGDLTDEVTVDTDLDAAKAGRYTITYTVSDKAGNQAVATRSVIVTGRRLLQETVREFSLTDIFTDTILPEQKGAADMSQVTFIGDETVGGFGYHGVITVDDHFWTRAQLGPADAAQLAINIGGQPAGTLMEELTSRKPACAVVLMGTTAIAEQDVAGFIDDYESMIQQMTAASSDTRFIILSLLPVSSADDGQLNAKINQANYLLCQLCAKYDLDFADAADVCKDDAGAMPDDCLTSDGRHPNAVGDKKVIAYLTSHLSSQQG